MSAETFTNATLSAAAGVTALVGAKIYPDEIPQTAVLPFIAFERAASAPEYTLNNTLAGTRVDIQVACWAATRIAAEQIADAVQAAMLTAGATHSERQALFDEETGSRGALIGFDVWE